MKLYHLNQIPENRIKSLFGLTPEVLSAVIIKVLPVLEKKRLERLQNNPERKRRFVTNDGRRREVLPLHKLLMTLVYLRHNCSHTVVGQMFDFSADSSENAFWEVIGVLREEFPASLWEAVKRHRNEKWSPEKVDKLLIDSFETPLPRPFDNERQRRVYSGKKKRHTLKTQVITDEKGDILSIEAGYRGPKSDIRIYQETKQNLPPPLQQKEKIGDKAYLGDDIKVPKKKPRGGELTEQEKEENRKISQKRIYVEHAIRKIKAYRIMRDEYRMATGIFPTVAQAVVGLIQFSIIIN